MSHRRHNPFGMCPPCESGSPVPGYGDPAGDLHLIGNHPGRHGGLATGVPFTETEGSRRLQNVLYEVGLLGEAYAEHPQVSNLFMNYVHMCPPDGEGDPSEISYGRMERYFDAELRAVNAHILIPVGRRATDQVLVEYTTQARKIPQSMDERHMLEVRGRGFLVIPCKDPTKWHGDDRAAMVDRLEEILASDYRQTKGVATMVG